MSVYVTTYSGKASGTIVPASFAALDPTNGFDFIQAVSGMAPWGIVPNFDRLPPGTPGDASQYAVTGDVVNVYGMGSQAELTAGAGGWSPSSYLKPDVNGFGVVAVPGDFAGAITFGTAVQNDIQRVLVLPPGFRVPPVYRPLTLTANTTLTLAQAYSTIYVTAPDKVITLPAAESGPPGLCYRFISMTPGSTTGTTVAISAIDYMYGNGFAIGFGKGAVNTFATAHVGDVLEVYSDGANWYIVNLVGVWNRQA